jgi:ubiquinone/menaquinone biosynthesis C-methylase UbiE
VNQPIDRLRRQDRFGKWAPYYENGEALSRLLCELQARAAANLHLAPDDRLLDVGCATGAAVRAASATVKLAVGVDSSPAMIQQAEALADAFPRAAFVVADAQELPFPPAAFSVVLCTTALRHFTDATGAVTEMLRVLTPAGRMVVADFQVGPSKLRRRWWRNPPPATALPNWAGLGRAIWGTGGSVTEVLRCGTVLGPYVIVSAVKPEIQPQR